MGLLCQGDGLVTSVAIGLLTCEREDYTRRTVESFLRHNDRRRFMLFHADDGSRSFENCQIAAEAGFETVYAKRARAGQMAGLRALVETAATEGADWFLFLESDWEWEHPFPRYALYLGAECVRLYGELKAKDGPRAQTGKNLMGTKQAIEWLPLADGLEHGIAHWAGPPSATRMDVMREFVDGAESAKAMSLRRPLDTVRVTENIVWHIGERQTPSFAA